MDAAILIVDDEDDIPALIQDYLEDETEFQVEHASSAEEGLELMQTLAPDLCMVDIRLPGMDGNKFIEKALAIRPSCKVIIHTGSLDYTIPPMLEQLGIREESILFKPVIQLRQYVDKINELLTCKGEKPLTDTAL
jgi:DNA-binding NtrC family response regulator